MISTEEKYSCSNCGQEVDNLFYCASCQNLISPLTKQDYFSALNLKCNFDLDPKIIDAHYEQQLILIHPDLFSNHSEQQQSLSIKYSSILHEAKKTLSDPFKRGLHILEIYDLKPSAKELTPEQQFLIKILELQEVINETDELTEISATIEKESQELLQTLNGYFKKLQSNQLDEQQHGELFRQLGRYRYYSNIKQQIKDK